MTFYSCSFDTILYRFYAMMFIGIASVATGYYAFSVLCLPLLLMSLLGVSFKKSANATKDAKAATPRVALQH